MKIRIIAAAILLPLLLAVVLLLPKALTAVLFGVLSVVGAWELLQGTGLVQQQRLVGYGMIMAFFVTFWSGVHTEYLMPLGMFVFFCVLFGELLIAHKTLPLAEIALTAVAGIVIPYLLSAVVRIHSQSYGRVLILLPFVIAFVSDTGAYFTGCALGKHKLAPTVSPKKTVEGFVGGIVSAVVAVAAFCLVMDKVLHLEVRYLYIPVYGILGSLAAVFGDLCFSAVKRQTGIKDYGKLIPGHGGVLDRFDSMIVVAPLVELLMVYLPMVVN